MRHPFYPSPELPNHVLTWDQALKDHKKDFGDIPGNAPSDLKPSVDEAKKLEPLATEIHDLEIALANKMEKFHKAAAPLWAKFSEALGYARTYAEKHDKPALMNEIRKYAHHTKGHAAKTAAAATTPKA